MDSDLQSDPKLKLRPVVSLQRLDLLQHLDTLSDDCLSLVHSQLQREAFNESKEAQRAVHKESTGNDTDRDDDIQIIEVKPLAKKERIKVEIRRGKQEDLQVRKLRKKALLSRDIFKSTVKRITSTTAVTTGKGDMADSTNIFKKGHSIKEPNTEALEKISGVMEVVNEKLATLKEREKNLMKTIRSRKKKSLDPAVREELEAMARAESDPAQSAAVFNFVKPALPEKVERTRKEMTTSVASNEQAMQRILQTPAKTIEEKYRILDARDKLFQSTREKMSDQGHRLVGTCPDMCPEKERLRRCYQAQLSPFEMTDYPRNTEAREEWMVKEYARSSADQDTPLPHDLRPVPVLQRTMEHLCRNIADKCEFTDELVDDWYMFMWDRTRAIRKDITHQDACSTAAVRLLEQCSIFHIHCAERLVDQDLSVYDDKINTENLTKCLQTLKYMYNDLRSAGVSCSNAPEFLCYSLLLNLNNPAIMTEVRAMPEEVISSEPILFALDLISAWETNDYIRFFKHVKKTTYLNCCLIRRYFSEMRVHAISTMVRAFIPPRSTSVAIPLLPLVENLLFESVQECVSHLELCNLSVEERDGVTVVILDKKMFKPPESSFPLLPSVLYIQEKKRILLSEIMWGDALGEPAAPPKPLQNSFRSSGEFIIDATAKDLLENSSENKTEQNQKAEVFNLEEDGEEYSETFDDYDYYDECQEESDGFQLLSDSDTGESKAIPVVSTMFSSKSIFATSPTAPTEVFGNTLHPSKEPIIKGFSFGNIFNSSPKSENPLFDSGSTAKPFFGFNQGESKNLFNIKSTFNFNTEPPTQPATTINLSGTFQLSTECPRATISPSVPQEKNLMTPKNGTMPLVTPLSKQTESLKTSIENDRKTKELLEKEEELEKIKIENLRKEKEAEQKRIARKRELELEEERQMAINRQVAEKKGREEEFRKQELIAEKRRLAGIEKKNKIKNKLQALKTKYSYWKLGVFARAWRKKAWALAEGRKMEKYLKELAVSYPPVCAPELLDGNPLGAVIPNVLLLKRRPNTELRQFMPGSKGNSAMSGPPPVLPLVHMGRAVASALKKRVQMLYPDPTSSFRTFFPWKLVLCLPDEAETNVRLDTFLEMHFVDRFDWKFGVETGPLYSCVHKIDALELIISVRRVKGIGMFEGSTANSGSIQGANSLLFFLTDDVRTLKIARQRLDKIRNIPGGAEIPVVGFVFGDRLLKSVVRSTLGLNETAHIVTCGGASQQSLVMTLSESLSLAADVAAPVPTTRSVALNSMLKTPVLDQTWRRVDVALVNFDILLKEPGPLITYYNQCLDGLNSHFLDRESAPHLAPEFESAMSKRESGLQFRSAPLRDKTYSEKLKAFVNEIKLPPWPTGSPKTTQHFNYLLHQYLKSIVNGDRKTLKNLKWSVYQVIQKALLWKGLDIYCNEDVEMVLLQFPWVQVFQVLAQCRVHHIISTDINDFTVTYDQSQIHKFCYEPPLLDYLLKKTPGRTDVDLELLLYDTRPIPEKDSILLAYSKAIKREIEAEEANSHPEPSLTEQVAELLEETIPLLMESVETAETVTPEASKLKRGLDELEDNIADLSAGLEKRRKLLEEMIAEMSDS